MNAISSSLSAPSIRRPSAFGNLVRKECLESRGVLIAGLTIFWLVPAALGLLELVLVGRRDVFPFAWLVVIGAGWLYAVIAGAHAVCRDWGKAEEHFLLAQPVSSRTVVCAKLFTGMAAIMVVFGIAVAWDAIWIRGTVLEAADKPEWLLVVFSAACVMAVGFAVALAVAVMTRQMLASIIVATLVLIVWAIAPLLSSHLARFWAPALLLGEQRATAIVPFLLVTFLMLVASVVGSFYCATRERVYRLGNKQLAWTTGLVMLTLFGVAMSEVGNSLRICDQVLLTDSGRSGLGVAWTIQRGDRFAVAYAGYRPSPHPVMASWFIATFRVSDKGQIQDMRQMPIPGMHPTPLDSGLQSTEHDEDTLTGFALDKEGHVVVSGRGLRITGPRQQHRLDTLWRTTLAWPDDGDLQVVSRKELVLPPGQRFESTDSWYDFWRPGQNHLPRYAYLVSEAGNDSSTHADQLYVFDWTDAGNLGPRFIIPLPQDNTRVSVRDGKVRISVEKKPYTKKEWLEVDFDADHPESLLEKKNWSFHEPRNLPTDIWPQEFERLGGRSAQVDHHGNVAYISDLLGLRVARQMHPGHWEITGESRTSPLSMLFRLYPMPQALDDSLVVEYGQRGIIAYDVSNPSNPKRVGFFNAVDLSMLDTSVFATRQYLVLREDDLITVLDRPVTGKP